jgi:hypothetical protein
MHNNVNFENYDAKSDLNTASVLIIYEELIGELKRIQFSKTRKRELVWIK